MALEAVLEKTQDFTDSAYTSHEHRQAILDSSDRLKAELDHLLGLYANVVRNLVLYDTLKKYNEVCFLECGSDMFTRVVPEIPDPTRKTKIILAKGIFIF